MITATLRQGRRPWASAPVTVGLVVQSLGVPGVVRLAFVALDRNGSDPIYWLDVSHRALREELLAVPDTGPNTLAVPDGGA